MRPSKILLICLAALLTTSSLRAQDQNDNQMNRSRSSQLEQLSSRLAQQADDLSEQLYKDYANRSVNNRNETSMMLLGQQFSATADIFRRMVQDRRRMQEMRDAASSLSDLARQANNNNGRYLWSNVQRSVEDIQRELNNGNSGGDDNGGGTSRSGMLHWRGTVDNETQLVIQGRYVDARAISGTPYSDANFNFTTGLPFRPVTLRVRKISGRGDVRVIQQPNQSNDYTAIVQVIDGNRGADLYDLEINW
jgi:hypothetical protein